MRLGIGAFAALAAAATLGVVAVAQAPEEIVGDWGGDLVTPSGDKPIAITFAMDASGVLSGQAESTSERPGYKILLTNVTAADGSLMFQVPEVAAAWSGTWDAATGTWSGTWTQDQIEMTLDLAPVAPAEE